VTCYYGKVWTAMVWGIVEGIIANFMVVTIIVNGKL
jgi:hypothetical protein